MLSRLAIGLVALAVAVSPQFIVKVDPPPFLIALTPSSGQTGSAVVLSGNVFGASQGTTTLTMNGVAVAITSWADTSITFTVPAVIGLGVKPVVMVRNGFTSNTLSYTITAPPAPIISSLSVSSGPVGTPVTITGSNFGSTQGSSLVFFNGVPATSYPAWAATSITTAVPTGATTGPLTVIVLGITSNSVTFTVTSSGGGEQIYLSSAATGGNTGVNCANAKAYTFFNSAANWSATVLPSDGKISPGDTVHLCGTITIAANTSGLTFQGSGLAGNPITLTFESGAILTSPVWPSSGGATQAGGIVFGSGRSYIVVNGGGNGILQATDNGSAPLTHQQSTTGISGFNCTNCEVKNLTISNTYVNTIGDGAFSDSQNMRAIDFSGPNWSIHDNVIHDCGWCLYDSWSNNDTNHQVYNNNIYHMAHGLMFASALHCLEPCLLFHDNHLHDAANWGAPGCPAHIDGVHVFGGVGGNMEGMYYYNNLFDGDWGTCPTGMIFIEAGSDNPSHAHRWAVWNNVFNSASSSTTVAQGWIGLFSGESGTQYVLNNTFIGPNSTDLDLAFAHQGLAGLVFENNLVTDNSVLIQVQTGMTPTTLDYNLWGRSSCGITGHCFAWHGIEEGSFANWKAGCGCDSHGQNNTSPGVNLTTGALTAGSPAIAAGVNLMSLATGSMATLALDTTTGGSRTGTARPAGATPWDIGAWNN